MDYYVGVDGGGTKTAVCAVCPGASPVYAACGSASWREYGIETVALRVKEAISSLSLGGNGRIGGIAVGVPCHGESGEGDGELGRVFREAFPGVPLYLTNDAEAGWAGSLAMSPGVNVVAGTGSIAYGEDQSGRSVRSGGWLEFFSDEGSCYWIGRKVMELFSKQSDGRTPKDALYETVRRELGLKDDFAFIDLMYGYIGQRDRVASLQLLAEKAALAGSASAAALYRDAAAELVLLVKAVRDRLNFTESPFAVSYSGGLFRAGELVAPAFRAGVEAAGGRLREPAFSPVEGALLLAYRRFCPRDLPEALRILKSK